MKMERTSLTKMPCRSECLISSTSTLINDLRFRDYAPNEALDHYDEEGIDDDGDLPELSAAARRAAEAQMARRDRLERAGRRGARAARRSRAPAFMGSEDDMVDEGDEDDELGVTQFKPRTRRQYDERGDQDDLEGLEDVRVSLLLYPVQRANPCPRNCQ